MDHIASLAGNDPQSRRYFMEWTAKMALGVGLTLPFLPKKLNAQAAASGGGTAKNLIYIFLKGGASQVDTFDPKASEYMGATEVIDTVVDDMKFGNHLPNLAQQADKLAVINSMYSNSGTHSASTYIMRTGYEARGTIVHPNLGPWAERLLGKQNKTMPDSVGIGRNGANPVGFLDPALTPLPIMDPAGGVPNTTIDVDEERFERRIEVAELLTKQFTDKFNYSNANAYVEYYKQARNLLKTDDLKAFDISGESNAASYGEHRFGQACLLARRLVEHGVRVIEINSCGNWDMHGSLQSRISETGAWLDQGVSALLTDLEERGLLDSTLVAIGTEFGRNGEINENEGRGHNPSAFSCVLAGGGIKGGTVYGKTNENSSKVLSDPVSPEAFLATLGYGLGLNMEEIVYSPSRRPFTFANKGKPVAQLFG